MGKSYIASSAEVSRVMPEVAVDFSAVSRPAVVVIDGLWLDDVSGCPAE